MIKNFTIRLLLFSIPLVLGGVLMEISLRNIPNDYKYKARYLDKHSQELDVLILGNSHAYRGIVTEDFIQNSFNASYVSQSLDIDHMIFSKYKDRMEELDIIILTISYPSLFNSLHTSVEDWRIKNYNIYYDFNLTRNPKNYLEIFGNNFENNRKRLEDYYLQKKTMIKSESLGSSYFLGSDNLKTSASKAAKRHTNVQYTYFKEYLFYLSEIIQFAKKNKIKIIFITPPVTSYYFNELDKKQLNLMNFTLDSLAERNENVYRINKLQSELFIDSDFKNGDHLNLNGAKKLTQLLNREIERLF